MAPTLPKIGAIYAGDTVSKWRKIRVGGADTTAGTAGVDVVVALNTTTYTLVNVPKDMIILGVATRISTAFSASVTLKIGDGDDDDCFTDSTHIAPTVAETLGVFTPGFKATMIAAAGGKQYLAADTIDIVVGGATPATGVMDVLINYIDSAVNLLA